MFVSGDYKAATDGITIEYTKQCLEHTFIANGLSDLEDNYAHALRSNLFE